jgi:cholesterol transport system auxiliary component
VKQFRWLSLWIVGALLTGCVGDILQSKVQEPQTYVLHTGDAGSAQIAYPLQLSIALPSAAPGLDTTRIAVLRNNNQLDYYFGARWGSTAPQVVQSFLVSLLYNQQGYKGVAAEGARIDADYLLELELRDFQAEYTSENSNPVVRVQLIGALINIKSRKAVATVKGAASVTAHDNKLSAVVAAFQSATQQAGVALSEQLTASLAKAN